MATFRLSHFSDPRVLRDIQPKRLIRFLLPYRQFFSGRGYELPIVGPDGDPEIAYQRLVDIFMVPTEATPRALLDALFLVDEMATTDGMNALIDEAIHHSVVLDSDDDQSPADVAVQVWLQNSEILERKHAEQFLYKRRTFEYYQTDLKKPPHCPPVPEATKREIERQLDDWFEERKRGRGSRIFVYPNDHEVRFLVRHGEPFKREESLSNTNVSSVCYRPLKYDVIVYDRALGELRINAGSVGERKIYRQLLGRHFFGDENCFPNTAKYTLEPLRADLVSSLACRDIAGVESIVLTEIQFLRGGVFGEVEIQRASDLFASLHFGNWRMPGNDRIIKATFKIKFTDAKTPRAVKIRPANIINYSRDSDSAVVEQWLCQRGFTDRPQAMERDAVA